jgi:hypothetical protein
MDSRGQHHPRRQVLRDLDRQEASTGHNYSTTRGDVSRNIYYGNNRDLFVEVSHGPYLVEHNIFGSPASLELFSQGGAFVNNLVCGTVRLEPVMDRATPYHLPHSTHVAGYAVIYGGDDRFVGNIFLDGEAALAYGPAAEGQARAGYGTAGYNGHPATFEEYLARIDEQPPGDHRRFIGVKQPVYIRENVYVAEAHAFEGERNPLLLDEAATAVLVDEGDAVYLETQLPDAFARATVGVVSGQDLERVRFVDADFEECNGAPAVMDVDLLGDRKSPGQTYPAGPIAALSSGASRVRVW